MWWRRHRGTLCTGSAMNVTFPKYFGGECRYSIAVDMIWQRVLPAVEHRATFRPADHPTAQLKLNKAEQG